MMSSLTYLTRVWAGSKFSAKILPAQVRPLSAHVKLTENCQARCVSCDYWKTRWDDRITTGRAVELLNEIGAAGIQKLRLTGGEPLLRRDLFQILQRANTAPLTTIVVQTNGLLLKKHHAEINDSPITHLSVSMDGVGDTNDRIRGIRGYFQLGMEGIKLLRGKKVAVSVTLNRLSAGELATLAAIAHDAGATLEYNILSRSLYFLKHGDIDPLWPLPGDLHAITDFLRNTVKRPAYEVDYVEQYYRHAALEEPACVLGYLQVFVLSSGDVMTGCYPLPPVGNILRDRLENILNSEAYRRQSESMVRRECPGCTCGVESSLAMKYSGSGTLYRLTRLSGTKANPAAERAVEAAKQRQPELVQIMTRGKNSANRSLLEKQS